MNRVMCGAPNGHQIPQAGDAARCVSLFVCVFFFFGFHFISVDMQVAEIAVDDVICRRL